MPGRLRKISTALFALFVLCVASPSAATILTFRAGDGGSYSASEDTYVQAQFPDVPRGTSSQLQFEFAPGTTQKGLIMFPEIFGENPGQIPLGATINSCTLSLTFHEPSLSQHTVHRITYAWDASTLTWNNFGFGLGGSAGFEYLALPEGTFTPAALTTYDVDITPICQAWSSGAHNGGVIILNTSSDRSACHSDNAGILSVRPLLTVDFSTATVPAAPPWGLAGLATALVGAGWLGVRRRRASAS